MPPDGPRERLADLGAAALSDIELIALVLGTGTAAHPAAALAAELLKRLGGLEELLAAEVAELASVSGVGPGKAARLLAAVELGRRALTRPLPRGERLTCRRAVDAALRPRLARERVEHFLAIPLDARHRPMGELRLATGGLTACPVDTGSVFRALVRRGAAAVVFVHNHPSGTPEPSPEDVTLTRRLRRAGAILGVDVVDHVIIGAEGFYSFLDAGLLHDPDLDLLEP